MAWYCRPPMATRTRLLVLGLVVIATTSGCRTSPPTPPTTANAFATSRARQSVSIQSNTEYRKALAQFQNGDYQAARAGINVLLKTPALSQPDTEFLNRQIAICDARLNPVSESPRRPVALSPSHLGDCGPRALQIVFRQLGNEATLSSLIKSTGTNAAGTSMEGLAKAAEKLGFKADGIQVDLDGLKQLRDPAIAWTNGNHYVAVLKVRGDSITIHDPNKQEEEVIAAEELLKHSGGILLTVSRK
jgi:hypothetical protein